MGTAGRVFGPPRAGNALQKADAGRAGGCSVRGGHPWAGRRPHGDDPRDRLRVCCCVLWYNTMVHGPGAQFLLLLAVVFSLLKIRQKKKKKKQPSHGNIVKI